MSSRAHALHPAERPVTVVVVARHALARESVQFALNQTGWARVVAESENVHDVAAHRGAGDSVWIVEVEPGCEEDLAGLIELREERPDARVLVISETRDPDLLLTIVDVPVDGYITMAEGVDELVSTVARVAGGETVIPGDMLGPLLRRLLDAQREHAVARSMLDELTRREREVLRLLSEGGGNPEIARELFISPETARTHIQNVLKKLGMHSRLEAASFVITNGLREELSA